MKKAILFIALLTGCETSNTPNLNHNLKIKDPPVPQIHTSANTTHNDFWAGPDNELSLNNVK